MREIQFAARVAYEMKRAWIGVVLVVIALVLLMPFNGVPMYGSQC